MRSIRRQLIRTILAGFGGLLLAGGAAIYLFTRLALLNDFDAGLRTKALAIMAQTEQGAAGVQVELPDTVFPGGNERVFPQYYELWQTNGTRCARSAALGEADLPLAPASLTTPVYWNMDLPGDRDGRAIGVLFTVKPEEADKPANGPLPLLLVVAADRHTLDATLGTLATVLVAVGGLTSLMTVPLVRLALRRGHAPLGELAELASTITADSLAARFPVASLPAELQPIAVRLNDLLDRLKAAFERERQFSADLAHELRTPLAELRTQAEVELAWPEAGNPTRHQETLNIALQMEAIVTRLLELARCENGLVPLLVEPVTLASLVDEVWHGLADRARQRQLTLQVEMPQGMVIQTDRTLLRSILFNLLANAVEYSQAPGQITIRWEQARQSLSVSNPVSDLQPDDMPHLFARLWRKDPARTGGVHCGLGLAVSRALARALRASLEAHLGEDGVITLRLGWEQS